MGPAFNQNLTLKHNVAPICDIQRFFNIMIGNQDTYVLFFQILNDALDVRDSNGVNTRKRLIQ